MKLYSFQKTTIKNQMHIAYGYRAKKQMFTAVMFRHTLLTGCGREYREIKVRQRKHLSLCSL